MFSLIFIETEFIYTVFKTIILSDSHGQLIFISCCRLAQVASFAHALQSTELASVGLPDFPIHNLVNIVRIMVSLKNLPL